MITLNKPIPEKVHSTPLFLYSNYCSVAWRLDIENGTE
jgi:hypothetical protein